MCYRMFAFGVLAYVLLSFLFSPADVPCYLYILISREPETYVYSQVEDFDDLSRVLSGQAAALAERYGDFFLAHLIEHQDESTKSFVAEVGGKAVGLLSATTSLDFASLQSCFDLNPYPSLREPMHEGGGEEHDVVGITLFFIEEAFETQAEVILPVRAMVPAVQTSVYCSILSFFSHGTDPFLCVVPLP